MSQWSLLLEDHLLPEGNSLFRDLWAPTMAENLYPACVCRALGTQQKGQGLGNVVTGAERELSYFACSTKSAFCWDGRLEWF